MKQLLRGAHVNGNNLYGALPLAKNGHQADVFNFCHPAKDQLEPTGDFNSGMHSIWKAAYHMIEELRETSRETANNTAMNTRFKLAIAY